jgi:hypothetical protein
MNPSNQSLKEAFGWPTSYVIKNIVRVTGRRYYGVMLWSLVHDATGYGSTTSKKICVLAGYDPYQLIGKGPLKPCKE